MSNVIVKEKYIKSNFLPRHVQNKLGIWTSKHFQYGNVSERWTMKSYHKPREFALLSILVQEHKNNTSNEKENHQHSLPDIE